MQDFEKQARKSQFRLILIILGIIFVFICVYTITWEINYFTKYNHFQKVEAEVIGVEIDDGQEYDVLKYVVDGQEYEKTTSYTSKNIVGDKIFVYYDVNSPVGIIYSLDSKRYLLPIITISFGCACLSLFIIYKISYPKTKVKKQKELTPAEKLLQEK